MEGICCLRIDNYSGMYDVLDHLIKMHNVSDIVYVTGKETAVDMTDRYKAYTTVLKDNNIEFDLKKVFSIERIIFPSASVLLIAFDRRFISTYLSFASSP